MNNGTAMTIQEADAIWYDCYVEDNYAEYTFAQRTEAIRVITEAADRGVFAYINISDRD